MCAGATRTPETDRHGGAGYDAEHRGRPPDRGYDAVAGRADDGRPSICAASRDMTRDEELIIPTAGEVPGRRKEDHPRIDHLRRYRAGTPSGAQSLVSDVSRLVRARLVSLGLVMTLGFLLLGSLVVSTALSDQFAAACVLAPHVHPKLTAMAVRDMTPNIGAVHQIEDTTPRRRPGRRRPSQHLRGEGYD